MTLLLKTTGQRHERKAATYYYWKGSQKGRYDKGMDEVRAERVKFGNQVLIHKNVS